MKNINLALFLCLFLLVLAGCFKTAEKPALPGVEMQANPPLYGVSFDVNDFSVEYRGRIKGQSLKELAAKDFLKYIYCGVFDTAGNRVHLIQQTYAGETDTSFGKITDSLPAGDYTFVFAASVRYDSSFVSLTKRSLADLSIFYSSWFWDKDTSIADLFFNKVNITVGETSVNNNIHLNRLMGQLEIRFVKNPDDTMAYKYDSCMIRVDNAPTNFSVLSGLTQNNIQIGKLWVGQDLFNPMQMSFLGSNANLNVIIFMPKINGQWTGLSKTISNVYVNPNKKTVLIGSPFENGKTTARGAETISQNDNTIIQQF